MLSVNARSQEPAFDARFEGPPFERALADSPNCPAFCSRFSSPIHGSLLVFTDIARFRRPALKARAEGPLFRCWLSKSALKARFILMLAFKARLGGPL
jgi:hypothetical protein